MSIKCALMCLIPFHRSVKWGAINFNFFSEAIYMIMRWSCLFLSDLGQHLSFVHFYIYSILISYLKFFFSHSSFVRMFPVVLGLFWNDFIFPYQWQQRFSADWGERSDSLTRLLNSRVPYSIHTEKGSFFTRRCFLLSGGEWAGMTSGFVILICFCRTLNFHHLLPSFPLPPNCQSTTSPSRLSLSPRSSAFPNCKLQLLSSSFLSIP